MVERLTEYVTKNCSEPFYRFNENSHISVRYRYCANIDKAINKLGKLEDIMEKYHCNNMEELDKKLTDADTWQKACELACDVILRFTDGCPCKADYFYQQAKKEGNDNEPD